MLNILYHSIVHIVEENEWDCKWNEKCVDKVFAMDIFQVAKHEFDFNAWEIQWASSERTLTNQAFPFQHLTRDRITLHTPRPTAAAVNFVGNEKSECFDWKD